MSYIHHLAVCSALATSLASAQVRPGDVIVQSPPSGNTTAIHRPDGTLIQSIDGLETDWWTGIALSADLGQVVFETVGFGFNPISSLRFDAAGTLVAQTLLPQLGPVSDFAQDVGGEILVADVSFGSVHVLTADGEYLSTLDVGSLGLTPNHVMTVGDGRMWVFGFNSATSTTDGLLIDRALNVYASASITQTIGKMALSPDGTFWATGPNNPRLRHLAADGSLIALVQAGNTSNPRPRSMDVAADGTVWVVDATNEEVVRIDSNGNVLQSFVPSLGIYRGEDIMVVRGGVFAGETFCDAVPNSTGLAGTLDALGTPIAMTGELTLRARNLPANATSMVVASLQTQSPVAVAGSTGVLCLAGPISRFARAGEIQNSGAAGAFDFAVDINDLPAPTGAVAAMAGQSWGFQVWSRDAVGGTATSNFTDGTLVRFL